MTTHTSGKAEHDRVADPVGDSFDITAYVRASRRAQQLPETVDDPAVLERLIALLRVAEFEKHRK